MAPLTSMQVAIQQAIAEGFQGGPIPTVNNSNINTQATLGNSITPVAEPVPYYPPATSPTPNLGLSLQGLDDIEANNMVTIDTKFGSTTSFLTVSVQLTSAQILALNTTPVQLIPAPGIGSYIVVNRAIFKYYYNSIAYSGTINLTIDYANPAVINLLTVTTGDFLTGTANGIQIAVPGLAVPSTKLYTTQMDNTPIYLHASANPTNGNGTVTVIVEYEVLTF